MEDSSKCVKLVLLFFVTVLLVSKNVNSQLAYPEEEPRPALANKDDRKPLYIPGMCKDNELLYPGDQKDDWICDCGAGYVYYPSGTGCFGVYRQGPCLKNQYLVLKEHEIIPTCVPNPCRNDSYVPFDNGCHPLFKPNGPCGQLNAGGGILGINTTTLQLTCLPTITTPQSIIDVPPLPCPPGSKRNVRGQCRQMVP